MYTYKKFAEMWNLRVIFISHKIWHFVQISFYIGHKRYWSWEAILSPHNNIIARKYPYTIDSRACAKVQYDIDDVDIGCCSWRQLLWWWWSRWHAKRIRITGTRSGRRTTNRYLQLGATGDRPSEKSWLVWTYNQSTSREVRILSGHMSFIFLYPVCIK